MIKETLKKLWLNDNEIIVYIELCTIWSSIASVLAKRTKINKSTIRYICLGLEKKWLIFSVKRDWTFLYTAESPRRLSSLIERQKHDLEKLEKNLDDSIEYFEKITSKQVSLPKVVFYEWKEWLKKLYDNILDIWEPIYSFEDGWEMLNYLWDYVDYFISERKKRKIANHVICPLLNPINQTSKEHLRQVKTIEKSLFPFTCDIKITWNHVSIISFENKNSVAISITDADIAKNFKILFDYIWKN